MSIHPLAYIADSDIICPDCTEQLYPAHCSVCGAEGQHRDYWHRYNDCQARFSEGERADDSLSVAHTGSPGAGAFVAIDHEGNPVSAIFSEEDLYSFPTCSVCGVPLVVCPDCGADPELWDREVWQSDDPPAWACDQDPERCSTCGALLEE